MVCTGGASLAHHRNQMFFIVTWQDSSGKTNYQRLFTDNFEEAKKIMRRKGVSSGNCKFDAVNISKKSVIATKMKSLLRKSLWTP